MFPAGRAFLLLAVGLTVVYLSLFFYLRSGARMRLERDWSRNGAPGDRDDWVDARIEGAIRRIRVALVVGVYILPTLALIAFIWISN